MGPNGQLYPTPPSIYQKIRAKQIWPFLTLTLWDAATANDSSLLAIARAIASVFLERWR